MTTSTLSAGPLAWAGFNKVVSSQAVVTNSQSLDRAGALFHSLRLEVLAAVEGMWSSPAESTDFLIPNTIDHRLAALIGLGIVGGLAFQFVRKDSGLLLEIVHEDIHWGCGLVLGSEGGPGSKALVVHAYFCQSCE